MKSNIFKLTSSNYSCVDMGRRNFVKLVDTLDPLQEIGKSI